jgi:hypothetical protein
MDKQDLNKDAASFESKEVSSSSIFGFSPIDEALDTTKEESAPSDPSVTSKPGLTESQNLYLA